MSTLGLLSKWSGTTASTAASRQLDRVVAEERARLTKAMCWIRFVLAGANALAVVPITSLPGYRDTWPARYGASIYFVMATLVLLAVHWKPALLKYAAYGPLFIDIPFTGIEEYLQATLALEPRLGTPATVALLMGFMMVSMLTLSRTVMLLVTPPTLILCILVATVDQVPFETQATMSVMIVGVGALGWFIVGRIRALVQLSRQGDLLGKYVLGQRIGVGGMAEVFLATYSPEGGFERQVAVKRILPAYAGNPEAVALFRREAEVGARLAHPNIVQVLDFGFDGTTYFLAMEHIGGASLAKVLAVLKHDGVLMPIPALVYLADQLADGLAYVHSRTSADGTPLKLVHRDFNPPNILLSSIGEVKIADFGIARIADTPALTQPGVMRGKLAYAAPEQLHGGAIDGRADLFSLGATLVEAGSSERVFAGATDVEVMRSLVEGPIASLHDRRPEVPYALSNALLLLLERDVERRTASADLFRAAITPLIFEVDSSNTGRAQLADAVKLAMSRGASSRVDVAAAETMPGVLAR